MNSNLVSPTDAGSLRSVEAEQITADDLLIALKEADVLKTLQITLDDLLIATEDTDVAETLRITYEVLVALKDSDVLEIFRRLPREDQANFLRWIGMTADLDARRRRTDALVLAISTSPFGPTPTIRERRSSIRP
jgi:hypothetical protein